MSLSKMETLLTAAPGTSCSRGVGRYLSHDTASISCRVGEGVLRASLEPRDDAPPTPYCVWLCVSVSSCPWARCVLGRSNNSLGKRSQPKVQWQEIKFRSVSLVKFKFLLNIYYHF